MKKDIAKRVTENESRVIEVIRVVTKSNPEVLDELSTIFVENDLSIELLIILSRLLKAMEDYKKEIEV